MEVATRIIHLNVSIPKHSDFPNDTSTPIISHRLVFGYCSKMESHSLVGVLVRMCHHPTQE